jgi:single-strand DNA-binding protein
MADLNEVRLIGRLTRDPELRSTQSGTYVGSLSLATNHKYKNGNGVDVTDVAYVDCTCFGKMAEVAQKYLHKGSQVFLGGRLKYESWDDKETGKKRSRLVVIAENIQFLDGKPSGESNGHDNGKANQQGATVAGNDARNQDKGLEPPKDLPF